MILLLVHVEDAFRKFFPEGYVRRLVKACEKHTVWHATSNTNDDRPIIEIEHLVDRTFDWGWGYEPEVFESSPEERDWLIESRGHDWTWVPPILRERPFPVVMLGGGYDSECLQDMREVLTHVGIAYQEREELIY